MISEAVKILLPSLSTLIPAESQGVIAQKGTGKRAFTGRVPDTDGKDIFSFCKENRAAEQRVSILL